ncbi:MAG TPA: regulatory protein RecX [Gemmatimonadaceae bacterium]|nr:regulatory protein RecX [Gemmatimonadaceae bacterium]
MSTITGITPSAKREGRFDLDVDGRVVATLSLDAIERLHLVVGSAFDDMRAEAVEREAAAQRTMDRALNMLAFRARSVRELRRALVRKGEPEATTNAAIDRLSALGLLDDRVYARGYIRAKVTGAGFSRRRLRGELARRGVAAEIIQAAIEQVFAEESVDEHALIERVALKKCRSLSNLDPATRRRRLYGYLARRGYELDDIRQVMARVLAERDDGERGWDGT